MDAELGNRSMPTIAPKILSVKSTFASDNERWQALMKRDPTAEGKFFYSVRTTGIFCRPNCAARLANRGNVCFHATCQDALAAGFRPCKRCRPTDAGQAERHATAIIRACRLIEDSHKSISLVTLASSAGMSVYHFHRVFKRHTGLTPKAYATAQRNKRVQAQLERNPTVTGAIYAAGFSSTSRFYASSETTLGMVPRNFRAGGIGTRIRFAVGECWLGSFLVAATKKGVCALLLGDDPEPLVRDLEDRFPRAELVGGDARFEELVAQVVGFLENPTVGCHLPLDIQGTAFQQRVWQALRAIPAGSTASYTEIAERLGKPKSVRAVAQACAANPLAVVIPCHRVVRLDGTLSGYRWGIERKSQLLQREQVNLASERSR
jgi:AraC family transcriptional regulator, regulatory protein of adaptative response / methylated-DNA-[protein]-cysteine methyltransferase